MRQHGGVFRDDLDGLAGVGEAFVGDGVGNLPELVGGDAGDGGKFEIERSQRFELLDHFVREGAADTGALAAKLIPGQAESAVSLALPDLAQTNDGGRGTAAGDEGEGLFAA